MALINRLSKLITADFHAVLDRIEEPDSLLRQAIREMEQALANGEQRLKWLQRDHHQLTTRADELQQLVDQINSELDVCFEARQSDLAKTQIKRKLEAERLLKLIARKRQQAEQSANAEQSELDRNRARLDSMKQKSELFAEQREQAGPGHGEFDHNNDFVVSEAEVEVAFLRESQLRAQS